MWSGVTYSQEHKSFSSRIILITQSFFLENMYVAEIRQRQRDRARGREREYVCVNIYERSGAEVGLQQPQQHTILYFHSCVLLINFILVSYEDCRLKLKGACYRNNIKKF